LNLQSDLLVSKLPFKFKSYRYNELAFKFPYFDKYERQLMPVLDSVMRDRFGGGLYTLSSVDLYA
jgi:hypothetical protein